MNGNRSGRGGRRFSTGFTLVEMLVSMTVLSMISLVLFSIFNQATMAWQASEKQIDAFREARAAIFMLRRDLGNMVVSARTPMALNQVGTVVSVPDVNATIGDNLFFLSLQPQGSQDPADKSDLCAVGYYVAWATTTDSASFGSMQTNNPVGSYNLHRYFPGGNNTCANLRTYLDPASFDPANPSAGLGTLFSGGVATISGDDVVARNITKLKIVPYQYNSAGVLQKVVPGVVTDDIAFVEITLRTINNDTAVKLGQQVAWDRALNSQTARDLLDRNEQVFITRIPVKERRP